MSARSGGSKHTGRRWNKAHPSVVKHGGAVTKAKAAKLAGGGSQYAKKAARAK